MDRPIEVTYVEFWYAQKNGSGYWTQCTNLVPTPPHMPAEKYLEPRHKKSNAYSYLFKMLYAETSEITVKYALGDEKQCNSD